MTSEKDMDCPICRSASEYAWRMEQVEVGTKDNNKKLDKLLWGIITNLVGIVIIFLEINLNS